MGLLVLIHKEKYFKEHLIAVQGAWLLKMPNSINVWEKSHSGKDWTVLCCGGGWDWTLQISGVRGRLDMA